MFVDTIMKVLRPIRASPEFIRDMQYDEKYIVVTKEYKRLVFERMKEYHGEDSVMCFPGGRECFFCEVHEVTDALGRGV